MKVIAIHQPQYLPWLGLVDRAARCDQFVVLDNVPYSKNYFYNRNQIKGCNGPMWITVPVLTKGNFGQTFVYAKIDNSQDWRSKHLKSIEHSYAATPFLNEYIGYFRETFSKKWDLLTDICMDTFVFLLRSYGIKTEVVRASELGVEGKKEELVINICKRLGATHYLSGPDGKNYLDLPAWEKTGIMVDFQNYVHPVYPQLYDGFVSNMSAIDLLFNCGKESGRMLTAGQPGYSFEEAKI